MYQNSNKISNFDQPDLQNFKQALTGTFNFKAKSKNKEKYLSGLQKNESLNDNDLQIPTTVLKNPKPRSLENESRFQRNLKLKKSKHERQASGVVNFKNDPKIGNFLPTKDQLTQPIYGVTNFLQNSQSSLNPTTWVKNVYTTGTGILTNPGSLIQGFVPGDKNTDDTNEVTDEEQNQEADQEEQPNEDVETYEHDDPAYDHLNGDSEKDDMITTSENEDQLPSNVDEELVSIDAGEEHKIDKAFIEISAEIRAFQGSYIECLDKFSDLDFNEENVDSCIGRGARFIANDIDYYKQQFIGLVDFIIKETIYNDCYVPGANDFVISTSCDLFQKDALRLLWSGMNYHATMDYHRQKYLSELATMPEASFEDIMIEFSRLYKKQLDLTIELEDHKRIALSRIKEYVQFRNEEIEAKIEAEGGLHFGDLDKNKIKQSKGAHKELMKLHKMRDSMPWVNLRKTLQINTNQKEVKDFYNPWSKKDNVEYQRSAFERNLIEIDGQNELKDQKSES